jgi:hypothetical protein
MSERGGVSVSVSEGVGGCIVGECRASGRVQESDRDHAPIKASGRGCFYCYLQESE